MDVSKFKIPKHWPTDAKAFAREAISEIQDLRATMKQALGDIITLKGALEHAQAETKELKAEIKELKAKLGTNSSNSSLPPSKDPPNTPSRESKPTGKKQGAQKGHPGTGRHFFPPERIDQFIDVFPLFCPDSNRSFSPGELTSIYFKPVQQIDLPEEK